MRAQLLIILVLMLSACDNAVDPQETLEPERRYTKSIERIAATDFEYELIEAAEAEYPPCDSVSTVVLDWQRPLLPDSNCWYYANYSGILFPYAVTSDAVNFYSGLVDSLKSSESDPFPRVAEFVYEAEVTFKDSLVFDSGEYVRFYSRPGQLGSFTQVYVVEMFLQFVFGNGLSYHSIRKMRIAVFDREGNLLRVFLDGEASVRVTN